MPLVVADRVRETTTTTGTGTITLAGAVTGYQSFSAIGNGNTTYYTINAGSQFEVGIGTYLGAGPTLSRDTVLESSNSGSLVNFAAGTKDVFVTYPAEKSISDGYGLLPIANGGTGATTAGAALTSLGAYPATNPAGYTTNTGTVTSVNLTAGTGVSVSGGPVTSSGAITVTNTAPDQVVSLTGAGTTTVSGTYPNFTVTSNDSTVGTVTSVGGTGTVNGITLTGTVTSSGSLTLGGTLSLTSGNVTTALGYTPYNATNPAGYITSAALSSYLPLSGGTLTGNLAIASNVLQVGTLGSGTGGNVRLVDDGGTFRYLMGFLGNAGNQSFSIFDAVAGADRIRIDASGNVLVGSDTNSFGAKFYVRADGTSNTMALFNSTANGGTKLRFLDGANSAAVGNIGGNLLFYASDANVERMRIDASGNVGIGVTPTTNTRMYVRTAAATHTAYYADNGADSGFKVKFGSSTTSILNDFGAALIFGTADTERMRIDASGNLLVGTTTASAKVAIVSNAINGLFINAQGAASNAAFEKNNTAGGYAVFNFSGTGVGSITTNGTVVTYNTSSDVRLKHDIVDAPEASNLIDAMQVRSFKWNVNNSEQRYGFVAQELVTVAPEAVSQPADPDEMMGVDYSKLVPMLVKEIQSLRARVAQLEGN